MFLKPTNPTVLDVSAVVANGGNGNGSIEAGLVETISFSAFELMSISGSISKTTAGWPSSASTSSSSPPTRVWMEMLLVNGRSVLFVVELIQC